MQNLHLSRVPLTLTGKASWSALLSIVHNKAPQVRRPTDELEAEKGCPSDAETITDDSSSVTSGPPAKSGRRFTVDESQWYILTHSPLIRHQAHACVSISRTTLISLMILTNARMVFQHSDAAGFRAGYASYNGQWYITWPIGQEAIAKFAPHDSHSATTDVYPPSFERRVDRCVQMLAGVIAAPRSGMQVAFPGRKPPGTYRLAYRAKGFPGAHGSRHLYNMMGGKVYEVDLLVAVKQDDEDTDEQIEDLVLHLPSLENGKKVNVIVPTDEIKVLKHALDCLPFGPLSWSIHRGLRDMLMAFSKPIMDSHRQALADALKEFVKNDPRALDRRGWDPIFVRSSMGDMAASAILAGNGNSGDLVRVVTDIVLAMAGDWDYARLDTVTFWREPKQNASIDMETIVALTKVFILEWSTEFDYQLYHALPISMYFV